MVTAAIANRTPADPSAHAFTTDHFLDEVAGGGSGMSMTETIQKRRSPFHASRVNDSTISTRA